MVTLSAESGSRGQRARSGGQHVGPSHGALLGSLTTLLLALLDSVIGSDVRKNGRACATAIDGRTRSEKEQMPPRILRDAA
ncbi:hypothetical protein AWV79_04965 [Cupriavidus sp. UYMMa02A]|nr:hypothetical protein AWV79_04965 [Cupriavidus sp. UYMMa02A]